MRITAALLLGFVVVAGCRREAPPPPIRVLLWGDAATVTIPADVASTPAAEAAFSSDGLAPFSAIVAAGRRGVERSSEERRSIVHFVQSGGLFVVTTETSAPDDWPWFERLLAGGARDYDGGRVLVLGTDDPVTTLAVALEAVHRDTSHVLPDDETFLVETVVDGLEDPIEIAVAASGDVYILERTGTLKRYVAKAGRLETIHRLGVASKIEEGGWAQECGGLGLALDPDFDANRFVYIYWSPLEPSVNRLSRFTLVSENGVSGLEDERPMFDVGTDRENTTCHEGGSLAFGPDGNLYLSTGDNTNPFESDGYAPIDEREDRKWWDAQRSSGNSNDLRGSVLRVRPTADGGYTIPDGNLWPATENARPEIFVKGCRNPYRMSIDPVTGTVYWGDVGPDADVDRDGDPTGTDELNQAKRAGFFGWPYVRGGRPYRDRDFVAGESGPSFADGIVNDSPNNTGLAELPPPVDPFFAYVYGPTEGLPEIGDGGRNAMAGPVIYADGGSAFPAWFDRVIVFYDWSRAHLWLVRLDEEERLESVHPWLAEESFKHPIDMERGPDGSIWLLEYGSAWWDNKDGRLRNIRFDGFDLRPRVVVEPSVTSGAAPLAVTFASASTVDPEGKTLRWKWKFGDGATSTEPAPEHVFRLEGSYDVEATVVDSAGHEVTWSGPIVVGNTAPVVRLETSAEGFFEWGESHDVSVTVTDENEEEIDPSRLEVTAEYLPGGLDEDAVVEEPLLPGMNPRLLGTGLLAKNGCASCHQPARASLGPSFTEVGARYEAQWEAEEAMTRAQLVHKVREGSAGTWGTTPMSPHRHLPRPQIENMIDAILSLRPSAVADEEGPSPVEDGTLDVGPLPDDLSDAFGVWVVRASYADVSPSTQLPMLTTTTEVVLEAPPIVTVLRSDAEAETVIPGPAAAIDGEDAARTEDAIHWWDDVETSLVYTVDALVPGTWRVGVEWGALEHEAGSTYAVTIASRVFEGVVPITASWDEGVVVELGAIDLPAGTHEIRVEARTIARRFVGNLRSVVLTPSK